MTTDEAFSREEAFHDAWARDTELESILVREAFEGFAALENRHCLRLMGPLEGKRILDLGAGLGETSVYFALQGARVTAVDISPEMTRRAEQLAAFHGTSIETVASPLERLDVADGGFDFVYGANVLHHVTDIEATLELACRALVPGGMCLFWDPIAYNPVINVYRRMASGVRTEDERPLRRSILKTFAQHFVDVRHREFWLLTLALFLKYYLIDRKDPNQVRYWKQIYREDPATTGRWFGVLRRLDDVLLRLWPFNWLAWNILVWARKPGV
ncbi:MAG: class I SAM-dependent methyltransferase [bacterium]|nr:class I SAM-dependent methyltransferase [bacterium]